MIDAHIIDSRGVYLRTEAVDELGAQPAGAVYDALPPPQAGRTRMHVDGVWELVPNADVPPLPTYSLSPPSSSCTRRQGRLALLAHGHLAAVEAAIAAIADPAERMAAQIEYEADTWERANPFLQATWAGLGGTPEQLDDLFRMAVTL